MFLSAVILILQELLEAALLISMLLVLTSVLPKRWPGFFSVTPRWVLSAIGVGIAGAWLYALVTPVVSTWFDYVGYEVVNATLQFVTIGFLLVFCHALNPALPRERWRARASVARISMVIAVAIGIVREGSEVILYVQGILGQPENVSPVMLGALMATGIGTSSGIVLFHSLALLRQRWTYRIAILLLGLFAGNMAAQAVQQLTQADWLPFTAQLWDSSAFIAESGITGKLLYALIGYEANPASLQVIAYLAAVGLIALSPLFRSAWFSGPAGTPR
jgi:high-affinity iron transporter